MRCREALGIVALFATVLAVHGANTQLENASPSIPDRLVECYRNQSIYHRENRLPMTLRTFLDLVRKVENSPTGSNLNMREIAANLIFYMKKDGIQGSTAENADPAIVPFAPSGPEYFTQRLLILSLISSPSQQTAQLFNNSLSVLEMCNLHFMMSHSLDEYKRDDESCSKIGLQKSARGRYTRETNIRALRQVREDDHNETKTPSDTESKEVEDSNSQVETISQDTLTTMNKAPEINGTKNSQFMIGNSRSLSGGSSLHDSQLRNSPKIYDSALIEERVKSECPVENGVIKTRYGSISIGTVIAGIAAGKQRQLIDPTKLDVSLDELNKFNLKSSKVDNLWASTLAGALSELVGNVGKLGNELTVGLSGGWNDSISAKWYLLKENNPYAPTDAELRGSLDGLWLGTNVAALTNNGNMKLSELLDKYYSPTGILGTDMKACNRVAVGSLYTTDDTLKEQTEIYTLVLKKQMINTATIIDPTSVAESAVDKFNSYLSSLDAGTECPKSNSLATEINKDYYLNLVIVIDNSWPVDALKNILWILMENEVVATPYRSNTTIICGRDGSVLFQGSDAISLSTNFTSATLAECASQLDAVISLTAVEVFFRQLYLQEQQSGRVNKGSYAALFLPYSASSTLNINNIWDKKNMFNTSLPDVKLLVATNGATEAFSTLVNDVSNDAFTIRAPSSTDQTTIDSITVLAARLQDIPQRLASPKCGSYFDGGSTKGLLTDDVQPGYSKFYLLQPNYFYTIEGAPKISVRTTTSGSVPITVCVSRTDPTPTGSAPGSTVPNNPSNPTQPDQRYYQNNGRSNAWNYPYTSYGRLADSNADCISVNQASVALKLPVAPCEDYTYISSCPPIYISVTAALPTSIPNSNCKNCRFSTNTEYEVTLDGLSCSSGAEGILSSIFVLVLSTALLLTARLI